MAKQFVFDQPHATRFVSARQAYLRKHLPELKEALSLKTALDVGCGVGHFSQFLKELGFEVTALDGREENIEEARRRHPGIQFHPVNVEDSRIREIGSFDLVLCFGLLYHLENPFGAIRNIARMTERLLLIESICLPEEEPFLYLRDEIDQEDQALRAIACYPSEGALIKMCYRAGFRFVYHPSTFPDHEDFCASLSRKRLRTMLAAARIPLDGFPFVPVREPDSVEDPWINVAGKVQAGVSKFRNVVHKKIFL